MAETAPPWLVLLPQTEAPHRNRRVDFLPTKRASCLVLSSVPACQGHQGTVCRLQLTPFSLMLTPPHNQHPAPVEQQSGNKEIIYQIGDSGPLQCNLAVLVFSTT